MNIRSHVDCKSPKDLCRLIGSNAVFESVHHVGAKRHHTAIGRVIIANYKLFVENEISFFFSEMKCTKFSSSLPKTRKKKRECRLEAQQQHGGRHTYRKGTSDVIS